MLPMWLSGKESACQCRRLDPIPGSGRSPERGNVNPLQYSSLEYSMDRGAWRAIVHGFTKSWTQLNIHTSCTHAYFPYYQLFLTPLSMLHKIGRLDT